MADETTTTTTETTATNGTATATAVVTPSWRDTLPDDLKADKQFEQFKDVTGLAKSYLEARKHIQAKPSGVPDEKAPPEAIAAFRKAQGVPDTPDGYQVTRPTIAVHEGWDEGAEKEFLSTMHALGVPPKVVQSAIDWYGRWETLKHNTRAAEADRVSGELHTEWGANYDGMVAAAQDAIVQFGGAALQQHYKANGMGRDPLTIKAWAKAGLALVEADVIRPNQDARTLGPDEAKTRIAEITAELKKLPHGHARERSLVDEIIALTKATG